MTTSQHLGFLESKVLTASSHQLHLMLIEGAVRFSRQARQALERGDLAAAEQPLSRAIDVVGEMLVGVRGAKSEISSKLASLYAFILQQLTDAKFTKEICRLDEALSILQYERETWQLLCRSQAEPQTIGEPSCLADIQAAPRPPLKLHTPPDVQSAGLSLEA
jgi:flagellar protein FliS